MLAVPVCREQEFPLRVRERSGPLLLGLRSLLRGLHTLQEAVRPQLPISRRYFELPFLNQEPVEIVVSPPLIGASSLSDGDAAIDKWLWDLMPSGAEGPRGRSPLYPCDRHLADDPPCSFRP